MSLTTGIYIDEWKCARVTVLLFLNMKTDGNVKTIFRHISILPVVSKAFEKEVFRQHYSYLTENFTLSQFQSEFHPNHSTVRALIQLCDECLENVDDSELNSVVFLDIKKAFDFIYHNILITLENE